MLAGVVGHRRGHAATGTKVPFVQNAKEGVLGKRSASAPASKDGACKEPKTESQIAFKPGVEASVQAEWSD